MKRRKNCYEKSNIAKRADHSYVKSADEKPFMLDFQLFAADGKTEKATPKKRQDARKKGQVFQSREITSALVLIFLFSGIRIFGKSMYLQIAAFTKRIYEEYALKEDVLTFNGLSVVFTDAVSVMLMVSAPILAIALITGLVSGYAQVGFLFTMDTLSFKFNRINPLSGFKRMFSMRSVVEMVKSLIKVSVIGYMGYSYLKGEQGNILNLMSMDAADIGAYLGTVTINVAIRMCIALILLGILDYAYQWWEYEKSLKMTKQEIKEEYKQTEGNPEIKSKIKQKQRQMSMRRMMQEVPKADVIITNPTHFAIAVQYDPDQSDAPIVTAKGQDYLAKRIKEIAKESSVQIVENRQLARALYDSVEIGQAIPPELYQAVAEILAFVYNLNGRAPVKK